MASPESACDGSPPLRADAERNRQRLVTAARQVFAERGLDAPIEDVARRAGVGVATLYRRFPTRADLIAGAFELQMHAYADAVADAVADPDPWRGFCWYVEHVCEMQSVSRGFTDVLTLTFPSAGHREARERAYHGVVTLITRAQAAGKLRTDVTPEDFPMILMASAGVITATGAEAPGTWRRLVALLLQALAADPADRAGDLPPPPSPRQMRRALQRLNPGQC